MMYIMYKEIHKHILTQKKRINPIRTLGGPPGCAGPSGSDTVRQAPPPS